MQFPAASAAWPSQVALEHPADLTVRAGDGRAFELETFRDACRLRAAELRRQAVADSCAQASSAMCRCQRSIAQWLRSAADSFARAGWPSA